MPRASNSRGGSRGDRSAPAASIGLGRQVTARPARPAAAMPSRPGCGTGARSATSFVYLQYGPVAACGVGGLAQVGQGEVFQADLADGPGWVVDRGVGADQEGGLPAGVTGRDDVLVCGEGGGGAAGSGGEGGGGQQLLQPSCHLYAGVDGHDEGVADPLQVRHQGGGRRGAGGGAPAEDLDAARCRRQLADGKV